MRDARAARLGGAPLCALLAALGGAACGGAEDDFSPPPDGFPWLATRYAVEVQLLGSDCAPGGLAPTTAEATAEVVQQGTRIARWVQSVSAEADSTWVLTGGLCPTEGAGFELRLRGGRVGRETTGQARCVVQAAVPTAHAYTRRPTDACTDDAALALTMDACGRLSAEFEAQLLFGDDCARPEPCTLRMRWTARPVVFPTGAPADDVRPPPAEGTAPCE